jgi:YbbR domain-containing protein
MERFLRSNNFARGLALFMAVALWLFVSGDNIARTTPSLKEIRDVPLTHEKLQPGLLVLEMPLTVDVTLEGLPRAFDQLAISEVRAYVDLSELDAGSHTIPVRSIPPRGFTVTAISPGLVEVEIELLQSVLYQVGIEPYGEPAAGWVLHSVAAEPAQVRVEAGRSLLGLVDRVFVRIDLTGRRDQFLVELAPLVVDAQGRELAPLAVIPDSVSVRVTLVREH